MLKKIFCGKEGYRIGWKIVFAFLVYCIASILSIIIGSILYQNVHITSFFDMVSSTMSSSEGYALVSVISILLLYFLFYGLVKHGSLSKSDLGIGEPLWKSMRKGGIGFLLGFIFICLEIFLLLLLGEGELTFSPFTGNTLKMLFFTLIAFAGVAFTEEITFRGYMQHHLGKRSRICGIVASAIIFAASHLINSKYEILSLVYLILGGLMFALLRLVSGSIWLPVGFHLAWNWTECSIFGLLQSGEKHWLFIDYKKATILNGGESGSGLIQIFVLLIILALLIWYDGRKKKGEEI
ncbi:MAG: CPBP family intramembrane metalloprotease [Lachnospiraceae bacterium]|nr:CPBP family intramembrane metalloprotease [Lachnospiraceae bacterium]